MGLMKAFGWSASLGAAAFLCVSCKMLEQPAWRSVFNGKSVEGWQLVGPGAVRLENNELVTDGGMGLFWYTREQFGDCRIRVLFKPTAADDNSGVFIRIPEPPADPWYGVHHGYEVQIENNGDDWHRTGCLYSITKAKEKVNARVNEWNTIVITLAGKRTIVEVNDVVITDYTEGDPVPPRTDETEPERSPRPDKGFIGLQNHGGDAHVHFREVSVAPLKSP